MGLGALLQAEAEQELERAARQLARPGEERHQGIHQARKSIRRVRAMLALAGASFSATPSVRRLDASLRSLCRGLSALRDADALRDALLHLSGDAVIGPILGLATMTSVANCDKGCELQKFVSHHILERKWHRDE